MPKSSSSTPRNAATVENRKSGWKGIQLRQKPASRPTSVSSQESRQSAVTTGSVENVNSKQVQGEIPPVPPLPETSKPQKDEAGSGASTPKAGTRSRASSMAASEVFEDAYDDSVPPAFDTPNQSEEATNEIATTSMSMIYSALQDTASIAEDDFLDDEDVMPVDYPPARATRENQQRKRKNLRGWRSSSDVTAEINALEIAAHPPTPEQYTPSFVPPHELLSNEDRAEEKKSPVQESQAKENKPFDKNNESIGDNMASKQGKKEETVDEPSTPPSPPLASDAGTETRNTSTNPTEQENAAAISPTLPPESTTKLQEKEDMSPEQATEKAAKMEESEPSPAVSMTTSSTGSQAEPTMSTPKETVATSLAHAKVTKTETEPAMIPVMKDGEDDTDEKTTHSTSVSDEPNRLGAILPAIENSVREIENDTILRSRVDPQDALEKARRSGEYEYPIEDPIDVDMFKDNEIAVQSVNVKNIPVNNLSPREQEEADEPVREGMRLLFDNKFMKAKAVFQQKSSIDPLYALGLGAMAFIKALMTYNQNDVETAMNALATTYTISKAQIDSASVKRSFKDTFSQYFSSLVSTNATGLPPSMSSPTRPSHSNGLNGNPPKYMPNGVLRAHVIKAECCLLMGLLQITKENVMGYVKCGLNLRRAYNSYTVAWQEYKKMGQDYTRYMDRDTVSAIQFGIGSVHLILSSLPPKILKVFSTLGWKSDKQLGFALLKLCLEGKGVRAPLASLILLSYYSILTSFAPQLYGKELVAPAVECLLEAQKSHPGSCFFLYFAARIARVTKNLPLSTQSFSFAVDSSRGEWAEVPMRQMALYETGWNHALQLDWESAAACFEELSKEKYWSPAFCKYFVGACGEMLGDRTRGILAFAEVPQMAKDQASKSYIDSFVLKKVDFFQKSGYQDMDLMLPGLELLLVWNAFAQMEEGALEKCLALVQETLDLIYEREKMEYNIRLQELAPSTSPPNYYDQRAILLLTKASILNALERHSESIAHLNWIMDHKDSIESETWVVPLAYWEAGLTSWGLGNYAKSRKLWQQALACSKYDFEYRMAVRLSVALNKCDEVGVKHVEQKEIKGPSTNGRKRMPIVQS